MVTTGLVNSFRHIWQANGYSSSSSLLCISQFSSSAEKRISKTSNNRSKFTGAILLSFIPFLFQFPSAFIISSVVKKFTIILKALIKQDTENREERNQAKERRNNLQPVTKSKRTGQRKTRKGKRERERGERIKTRKPGISKDSLIYLHSHSSQSLCNPCRYLVDSRNDRKFECVPWLVQGREKDSWVLHFLYPFLLPLVWKQWHSDPH